MSKKFSVPVQKGPINPTRPPPSKMQTRMEKDIEDYKHDVMRRDGMTLRTHIPKK